MNKANRFKPLWMIHNRTYRKYAKGVGRQRCRRYLGKIHNLMRRMRHIR